VDYNWVENTPIAISYCGIVQVQNVKDLVFTAEGDRVKGDVAFYSTVPFILTNGDIEEEGIASAADRAIFRGETYKLFQAYDYGNYGYYKAIGVREAGC